MDLELSLEQKMLKSAAERFLDEEYSVKTVREIDKTETGHSDVVWKKMAELGWLGLIIPEEYGGSGMSFLDMAVLLEEMGRHLLSGAFFSTTILGAMPLLSAGTDSQKQKILPRVAEGSLKLTLALAEESGTFDAGGIKVWAKAGSDGYSISGTKLFVENAHISDFLLCAVRTEEGASSEEGITLFLLDAKDPGVSAEIIPATGLDRICEVKLDNVKVSKQDIVGEVHKGWPVVKTVLEIASVARSAQMLGALVACMEMTNAYAKERVQYGSIIGSFQAVQHRLANIWTDAMSSRDVIYRTAWMMSEGMDYGILASAAKAHLGQALGRSVANCIHIHGAIGVTEECDLGLYYRQAKAWDLSCGNWSQQLELITRELRKDSQLNPGLGTGCKSLRPTDGPHTERMMYMV